MLLTVFISNLAELMVHSRLNFKEAADLYQKTLDITAGANDVCLLPYSYYHSYSIPLLFLFTTITYSVLLNPYYSILITSLLLKF
jgi:hypothetical protein